MEYIILGILVALLFRITSLEDKIDDLIELIENNKNE